MFDDHQLSLTALVQAAVLPIYGLANHSLGLTLCSFGSERLGNRPVEVTLVFADRSNLDTQDQHSNLLTYAVYTVSSYDPMSYDAYIAHDADLALERLKELGGSAGFLLQLRERFRNQLAEQAVDRLYSRAAGMFIEYGSGSQEKVLAGRADVVQLFKRDFLLEDVMFSGEVFYWSPSQICSFILSHNAEEPVSRLIGAAYGIPTQELFGLIERMVAVNNHPEILARYEAEFKQR